MIQIDKKKNIYLSLYTLESKLSFENSIKKITFVVETCRISNQGKIYSRKLGMEKYMRI